MKTLLKEKLTNYHHRLDKSQGLLKVLNPQNVLERGYGYLEAPEGSVITSAAGLDALSDEAQLNYHFHDGKRLVQKASKPK